MKLIDREYYLENYAGQPVDDEKELDALIERASFLIDSLIMCRISHAGGLYAFLLKYKEPAKSVVEASIKDAVACEAEYLFSIGGAVSANNGEEGSAGTNVKIGGFSYSEQAGKTSTGSAVTSGYGGDSRYCKSVYSYLERGGLLDRGCNTI